MARLSRLISVPLALALAAVSWSCSDEDNVGSLPGPNRPPVARFASNPQADSSGLIRDDAPLTVTFNMCGSTDPDPRDDLRYEFWWDGRSAQPDAIGACRMSHTFEGGGVCSTTFTCVWDRQPGDEHRVCKQYLVCRNS